MKRALNAVLSPLGLEIVRKSHPAPPPVLDLDDVEKAAREAVAKVRGRTMLSAHNLTCLFEQVRHCELTGIPGSFVECGVWKGGAGAMMALSNLAYGKVRRPIHLFDVFDAIGEPDPEVDGARAVHEIATLSGRDPKSFTGRLESVKGVYDQKGGPGLVPEVQALFDGIGYPVTIHKGWFQDTVPVADTGQIAILRLDGDYYASTKVCLDHLYDRVVPNGFVIIDDYGAYQGCRKAVDEFRAARGINAFLHRVTVDCRYWVKA